jgi:glycosyltransferase involved in cell wall biosynthesis
MDGGSNDETISILNNYRDRFYWTSEKDEGQANAINKGWSCAKGDILAYLNSDDIYLPNALSKTAAYLEKHPEAAAVYGDGYHIKEDGTVIDRYPTEPYDRKRLAETCFICQPTVFIRRRVLEEIGFLDESLSYCMDYDLWLRIAERYPWSYLPEYLACTRFYPETKTLGKRVEAHKEIMKVVFRHNHFVPPSWIYGYGHALCERYFDREKPSGNLLFITVLISVSLIKFIKYNHCVPISEWKRWREWVMRNFRKHFFSKGLRRE